MYYTASQLLMEAQMLESRIQDIDALKRLREKLSRIDPAATLSREEFQLLSDELYALLPQK